MLLWVIKMTTTQEGKILAKILKFARLNNIKYIRLALQPFVETGWPDVVFLLRNGVTFWVEIKSPGKEPTPKQWAKLDDLSSVGHIHGWFDDADAACRAVSSLVERIAVYDKGGQFPQKPLSRGIASGSWGKKN